MRTAANHYVSNTKNSTDFSSAEFFTCSKSISFSPVNHLLGGFAAVNAGVSDLLLMEGHATAGYAELFLHGILTLTAAAPHSFDETRLVVSKIFHLFFVVSLIGMAVTMFLCFLEKVMLDAGQDLRKFGSQLVDGNGNLLSGISSYDNSLT